MTTDTSESAVLDSITADEILADLRAMVGFASVGGSAGEVAVQDWCAERLDALGADVDRWEIDVAEARQQPDFPGMEVERDRAVGVVGRWGPGRPGADPLRAHRRRTARGPGARGPATRSRSRCATATPSAVAAATCSAGSPRSWLP